MIYWRAIALPEQHRPPAAATFDDVAAWAVLLEDDWVVYLEADDGATTLVIDLAGERGDRVRRVPVGDLEPGLFVLLRTEGGRDYIVDMANHILGEKAAAARASQFAWKERLRQVARARGLAGLRQALRSSGSPRASEANVRRWMSNRSISTDDERDFAAIMRITGLAERTGEFRETMRAIEHAHLRAGQVIRHLLLRQVRAADLRALERRGRMDFELPDVDGGRLTAFRITGIAPETVAVPASRIAHPFTLEATPWRA